MESYEKFWLDFWKIVGMCTVAIILSVSVTLGTHSTIWHNSWNKCIEKGGEPKQISIIGSNEITFTCDFPQ